MKRFLLFFLVAASLISGQNISDDSSGSVAAADSVNIGDIVREQIERAKMRQSADIVPAAVREANLDIKIEPVKIEKKQALSFYYSLPLHYQIFFAGSIFVLFVLAVRRTVALIKRQASRGLKNKIALLREEKVIVRANSKLAAIRKKLRGRRQIYDDSETQLSKAAKNLKIAKGELLLASRLKLYELGKT
ncbi:MAG: hypothetical protein CVV24_02385 [Ignavibacteriae bacterium HGW-Ignavibacteriae-3]|nr:MAG: hypothetical protein CVV24_02385 [Ignavibacteriae bacterium HGW-Ignavibacteriae-3]